MTRELYYMPENSELLMAAIAAIQHHIWFKVTADGEAELELTLVSSAYPGLEWREFLLKTVGQFNPKVKVELRYLDAKSATVTRGVYDVIQNLNIPEKLYRMSEVTQKNAATCYGILIGSDPNEVPEVGMFEPVEPDNRIIVDARCLDLVSNLKSNDAYKSSLYIASFQDGATGNPLVEHRLESFRKACMVVGMRSVWTCLAAAFGKEVVELYPADVHPKYLSKFCCERYSMIYGEQNFTAEHVGRAIRMLIATRKKESVNEQLVGKA